MSGVLGAEEATANEVGSEEITMAQRAAVIISILGEEVAKPIVEDFDNASLKKVDKVFDTIHSIPIETTAQIVVDFIQHLTGSTGVVANGRFQVQKIISDLEKLRAEAMGEAEIGEDGFAQLDLSALGIGEDESVWERLQRHTPERIAEYMNRLTPNLISLILRQMPVGLSSDIFTYMKPDKLPQVMGYMVSAGKEDPAIIEVVERMVEIEFLLAEQDVSEGDEEHLEAMGELLTLIPADRRDNIVSYLQAEHEQKLIDIQKSLFTIEGIPETLPRNSIPIVVKEIDADELIKLIVSLQGRHNEVEDFILENISSRQAAQIKEDVGRKGALSDEDAEEVQRNFLMTLMDLKRQGMINLN